MTLSKILSESCQNGESSHEIETSWLASWSAPQRRLRSLWLYWDIARLPAWMVFLELVSMSSGLGRSCNTACQDTPTLCSMHPSSTCNKRWAITSHIALQTLLLLGLQLLR